MNLTLKTWKGVDITPYQARIRGNGSPVFPAAQPDEVQRSGNWPIRGGKKFGGNVMIVDFSFAPGSNAPALWDTIGMIFDPERDDALCALVGTDSITALDWRVYGESLGLIDPTAAGCSVAIHTPDPTWSAVTVISNSKSLTASGQTKVVTVYGNLISRPKFTYNPTTPRTGSWAYKRYVLVLNRTDRNYSDAINFADSNWNTAALVSGGKMLASGADLRILRGAVNMYRWFGGGGINTTTTRPFAGVALPPQVVLTLSGTISNVGAVSTITVKNTNANISALKKLAAYANKLIVISAGTASQETYKYTSVSLTALTITGCTRLQRGSTVAKSQIDGAEIRHVPIDYYVIYGNSAAPTPTTDDNFKPMFDLTNSTNASHVYADYKSTTQPSRIGQWVFSIPQNLGWLSKAYTANHYTVANPASEMGMAMLAYKVGGIPRAPTARMQWTLYHPAGITSITPSGEKYRKNVDTGWPDVKLKKSNDGLTWTDVSTEATPSTNNVWEATTTITGAQSMSGTYLNVGFFMEDTIAAIADTYCAVEFDSITVALDTTTTPLISFGAEQTVEYNELRIANSTTGKYIDIVQPGDINNTLIIDTDARDAYVLETGEKCAVFLDDESRSEWLPFDPNSAYGGGTTNTITITQTGLAGATLLIEHYPRNGTP